jgi:hypothetical protein
MRIVLLLLVILVMSVSACKKAEQVVQVEKKEYSTSFSVEVNMPPDKLCPAALIQAADRVVAYDDVITDDQVKYIHCKICSQGVLRRDASSDVLSCSYCGVKEQSTETKGE